MKTDKSARQQFFFILHSAFKLLHFPMPLSSRHLDPAVIEQLSHLQLAARSVVEGSAVGLHRSRLKGSSIEFRQHRAYVAGDEPRRLDWRVLARTNRPFVKEYDEETNLRCLLMLDCSGSMNYGTDEASVKFSCAGRVAAALAYLMLGATESVGVALFAQKLQHWLAPRSSSLQLSRVIDTLEHASPAGPADVLASTMQIASRLGRRALVILLSDFFSKPADIRNALARLRHDRHELICLRILHPDERTFPFKNWSLFQGLEGERSYLCQPGLLRKTYLARFEHHAREITTICRSMNADLHEFSTDIPAVDLVRRFLKSRAGAR
jgi:uncharacterized protein (DUF58 family)